MDTLPLFLKMIKAHPLLYPIIASGDLSLVKKQTEQKYYFFSENAVELTNFELAPNAQFKTLNISILKTHSTTCFSFQTSDPKYLQEKERYFGSKTIYHDVEPLLIKHGVPIKHKYLYLDFEPPISISIKERCRTYHILIMVGSAVPKENPFKLPPGTTLDDVKWKGFFRFNGSGGGH